MMDNSEVIGPIVLGLIGTSIFIFPFFKDIKVRLMVSLPLSIPFFVFALDIIRYGEGEGGLLAIFHAMIAMAFCLAISFILAIIILFK